MENLTSKSGAQCNIFQVELKIKMALREDEGHCSD